MLNVVEKVLERAPLKMSIFKLGEAVTRYDEKVADEAFIEDVKKCSALVTRELAAFGRVKGLTNEQAVQADRLADKVQHQK